MTNLARCSVVLFLIGVSSNLYAQEWVGYNQYVQPQPQVQTVYLQPQPVVIYQWVPYSVQQNVVVEQRRFFCINQTVISRPIVQWVLQPMVIYR
jgi:hypothetical protein